MKDLIATIIIWVMGIALGALFVVVAFAQEHRHTDGSVITGADAQFYNTWMRRDVPTSSCCNLHDCWPAEMRVRNGNVEARHVPRGPGLPYGPWMVVPPNKVEQNYPDPRESPSGLNHLCAVGTSVLCFTQGTLG